ncbi:MAG TPA: acetylornithine deacetylase [Pyrinomonadaceae bacterium]|jgi:acetylornithine deacetylase|nr:acetylornithine deacetylase [Pyrinomonadaceae bacterium]
MTVQKTLAELVAIDSVSARPNAEIIDYLSHRCETRGLLVKRFPYTDASGVEKINLIALAGAEFSAGAAVELALVGHTDTVPYDANWTDALRLTEREGKLFGRGACDTKAFIAATLAAVETIDLKKLRRGVALVFTADEEIGLIGAKRLAESRPFHLRYAIVGEPTSLRPMRAGKGYCVAEVTISGREAHSAYPALGSSAVFGAARLIAAIEGIAGRLETEQHAAFDPPFTTLNVGLVHGGTAKNVIPGECRFTLEWRPIPGEDPKRLLDLLFTAIEAEKKRDPNFGCEVDAARADEGFETSRDSTLVTLLEELTANESGTVAFGTEAAQLAQLGAEAVVFGPGDIRVAHRTGEFVPIAELEACVNVLRQAIACLCL